MSKTTVVTFYKTRQEMRLAVNDGVAKDMGKQAPLYKRWARVSEAPVRTVLTLKTKPAVKQATVLTQANQQWGQRQYVQKTVVVTKRKKMVLCA